jgi:hypothetical protein
MTTTKRITVAAILKAIGNKNLNLYKGAGYYYFSYSDESKNLYETKSVVVCALNHLQFDQWLAEGRELVAEMEPAPRQPGFDLIDKLRACREALSRTPSGEYIHKHEMQELWDREQEILRGMEAERRAEFYLEWIKSNQFDRNALPAAFYAAEKANGFGDY